MDLFAPGTNIYSTMWSGGASTYTTMSGTSMATPYVAGAAALLWGAYPSMNYSQVGRVRRDALNLPVPEGGSGMLACE